MNIIYHGTSIAHLDTILKEGIHPRRVHNNSNWKKFDKSNIDFVYLSRAYAPYFAIAAKKTEKAIVIFEIDFDGLDENKIFPDDDFLRQALKDDNARTKLRKYQHTWRQSLQFLGNCSYNGHIDLSLIKRYAILDTSLRMELMMRLCDPSISIMNYKFLGRQYEAITKWIFGDIVGTPEEEKRMGLTDEMLVSMDKVYSNRAGITVVDLQTVQKTI